MTNSQACGSGDVFWQSEAQPPLSCLYRWLEVSRPWHVPFQFSDIYRWLHVTRHLWLRFHRLFQVHRQYHIRQRWFFQRPLGVYYIRLCGWKRVFPAGCNRCCVCLILASYFIPHSFTPSTAQIPVLITSYFPHPSSCHITVKFPELICTPFPKCKHEHELTQGSQRLGQWRLHIPLFSRSPWPHHWHWSLPRCRPREIH